MIIFELTNPLKHKTPVKITQENGVTKYRYIFYEKLPKVKKSSRKLLKNIFGAGEHDDNN